jgi:hypothetical protein
VTFYKNKPRTRPKKEEPLVRLNSHVAKVTGDILLDLSVEMDLPISKLIAYALDNEMDCAEPFKYDVTIPDVPYREFEYADEASKLLKYLMKNFASGTGLDMLVLCRRDIGVPDKARLLLGYRELLKREMVEEFYPQHTKFRYGKNYRYIRPTQDVIENEKNNRLKKIKPISELTRRGPLYEKN